MRQIAPRDCRATTPTDQHAAVPDTPLEHRRRAGVEPRQHLRVLRGGETAVAVDRYRREVAAARCAERLEHRMAELERADARRVAARPIDGIADRGRQQVHVRRPGGARPGGHEQPAALLDELARAGAPAPALTATSFSTTTALRRRSSSLTASGLARHGLESRRLADRQRAASDRGRRCRDRRRSRAPARTATRRS